MFSSFPQQSDVLLKKQKTSAPITGTEEFFSYGLKLLKFNLSAGFFKLSLESFSVVLGASFLEGLGSAFNSGLSLSKSETGDLANNLDDLDLSSSVKACKNNVEFGLLFYSSGSAGSGSGNSNSSSCANAKSVFYFLYEFCKLKNRESSNFVNNSNYFFGCHFKFPPM